MEAPLEHRSLSCLFIALSQVPRRVPGTKNYLLSEFYIEHLCTFLQRINSGTSGLEAMCIENIIGSPIYSSESCTNLHFPLVNFQEIGQFKDIDCISDSSINEFKIKKL